jgi:general secretion pathway protein D
VADHAGSSPAFGSFGVRTDVLVPDGGTALLGSITSGSDNRREAGVPVLGRLPVAGRPFRSGSFGRTMTGTQSSVRVRIIDLEEEELRQTGYSRRR